MSNLLKKENILYESLMSKKSDNDSLSVFSDYASFITDDGVPLIAHINNSAQERNKEEEEIQDLYTVIFQNIIRDTLAIEMLVKKLKLEKDELFSDRLRSLHIFLDKNYAASDLTFFDNPQLEFMDILKGLDELGYRKKISKYIILSASNTPYIKDAVAFEGVQKYYSLRKAFTKKHSMTAIGSLVRIIQILNEINNPESTATYSRDSYIGDIEKIHTSITLENLNKPKQVFSVEGDDILHYIKGKLVYEKVGLRDPVYIQMFKNIIRYMPADVTKIRISNFTTHVHADHQIKDSSYRNNLTSQKTFVKFLGKNGLKNIHPTNNEKLLHVTDNFITFHNNL